MTLPLRVLIADDHPLTRSGVRHALEADGFDVVAEVADAPKAVAAAQLHRPEICVRSPGSCSSAR